jgi:hypothetical protein
MNFQRLRIAARNFSTYLRALGAQCVSEVVRGRTRDLSARVQMNQEVLFDLTNSQDRIWRN